MSFRQMLKQLWPFMLAHKWHGLFVICAIILFVTIGRSLPLLFGYAIDNGIKGQNYDLVVKLAFIYLVLELLRSVAAFCQDYFSFKLGNRILYEIRETVISHIQRLPLSFFDKNPIGRTVTRVTNDIVSLGDLFNQGFTAIFVNTLELASIVIALSVVSLPLTFATVLIAPVTVWLTMGISRRIRQQFALVKRRLAEINAFTSESLNGMGILQLYNRVDDQRKKFETQSQDYRNLQFSTVRLFALLWPILSFFNLVTIASALLIGGIFYEQLGLTVGALSAFIILLQSFFRPIRVILERYNQFQNSLASADRVFKLLAEPTEILTGESFDDDVKGRIEIKNLTFKYGPDTMPALADINLNIPPGESVALVGRTGSGKSTLVALLQKFYTYTDGEILIDGKSLNDINPSSLREHIGVVQQSSFIFKGTIYSNITLGNPAISEAQVTEAVRRAHCQGVISRQGGLHAPIEEKGANLSVGEKQLISFARALAYNPDILILDEATANIDSHSEQLIQQATSEITKGRTSIIIAHRLSTILDCDRIILLDHGRIIEQGSHQELIKKKGPYWSLYQSQFKSTSQVSGSSELT